MKTEPLSLEHAGLLSAPLKKLGNGLSEYEFANLFLFRQVHDYVLFLNGSGPVGLSGTTYDGKSCFLPLFDPGEAPPEYLCRLIEGHDCFFPIPHRDLKHFDPERFVPDYQLADADYVYRAETFKYYKGRKLAKKRNLVKQFLAACTPDYRPYRPGMKKDAESVLNRWQRHTGKSISATDYCPALEALSLSHELNLFGFCYYVHGAPEGFLLAGENTPGMCTIHFAKANRQIKGIFPYMFHHFANAQGDRFRFYNFEQDLGKPNFRKTKRSYQPDRLLIKYRIKAS